MVPVTTNQVSFRPVQTYLLQLLDILLRPAEGPALAQWSTSFVSHDGPSLVSR